MKRLNLISTLMAVFLMVACTNKDAKNGASSPAPVTPKSQGTGDWGGGNGKDNKVFESYIIKVQDLPEFKEILLPISQRIDQAQNSDIKPENRRPNEKTFFELIAQGKTWYLAPVSLQVLEKEKLGVSFSKDPIQQLAIQTDHEVWIDSDVYKKMSKEERGSLILHELMMIFYQTRFLELSEVCRIYMACDPQTIEHDMSQMKFKNDYKTEPKRELTPVDYSNIRGATGFLTNHFADINDNAQFSKFLMAFGFGRRSYYAHEHYKTKHYKIERSQIINAMTEAVETDLPSYCNFSSDAQALSRCRTGFFVENDLSKSLLFPILSFKTTGFSGPQSLKFEVQIFSTEGDVLFKCPSGVGFCFSVAMAEFIDETKKKDIKSGDPLTAAIIHIAIEEIITMKDGEELKLDVLRVDTIQIAPMILGKMTFEDTHNQDFSVLPKEFQLDLKNIFSRGPTIKYLDLDRLEDFRAISVHRSF